MSILSTKILSYPIHSLFSSLSATLVFSQGVAPGTPLGGGLLQFLAPTPPIEETCCLNLNKSKLLLRSVIQQRARCCGIGADGSETRRMVELEKDWTGRNAKRRKWINQRRERRNESEEQRKLEQNHYGINADNSRQAKRTIIREEEQVARRRTRIEEEQDATRIEEEQDATRIEEEQDATNRRRRCCKERCYKERCYKKRSCYKDEDITRREEQDATRREVLTRTKMLQEEKCMMTVE
ncbi:hypothetical protein CEXT_361321 [Caerostris extrusa]|uniref:Uncharacterized protein n=1 Tax=Caerostris extrusa TaxID=172846 RepID=A0AAV4XSW9_CAEEX|nr:hypothetical protein CEXT_361321 [Caerostris extrusa]